MNASNILFFLRRLYVFILKLDILVLNSLHSSLTEVPKRIRMSKLTDYSKFDNIDVESSDDEDQSTKETTSSVDAQSTEKSQQSPVTAASTCTAQPVQPTAAIPATTTNTPTIPPVNTGPSMRKNHTTGRYIYEYNGRPVYEWEQKLEDVTIYLPAPPIPSQQLHCQIFPHRLELGIRELIQTQGKYFLQEETFGLVDVSESTWYLEDATTLVIYLAKAKKGEVWDFALKGNHNVNTVSNNTSSKPSTSIHGKPAIAQLDPMVKQEIQKDMMLERFQEENPGMDFRGAEFNGSVPDPRTFMGGVKYT